GNDSGAHAVDFAQPVFSEDWSILHSLDTFYQNKLMLVGSLFQAAQKAGLRTAAIGKSGPAFLQDRGEGGLVLDEKMAWPLSFAKDLQGAGYKLPKMTPNAHPAGTITLAADNGDPTAAGLKVTLADGVSPDASDL